jgi:hypothetical protein
LKKNDFVTVRLKAFRDSMLVGRVTEAPFREGVRLVVEIEGRRIHLECDHGCPWRLAIEKDSMKMNYPLEDVDREEGKIIKDINWVLHHRGGTISLKKEVRLLLLERLTRFMSGGPGVSK